MPTNGIRVAIFGGTGTAGDGVLKAVMADNNVAKIHVVTRRVSPRMEQSKKSGKIEITLNSDYLDYSSITGLLGEIDTVYWALGTSSLNVTDDEYSVIHVDYPVNLAREWLASGPGDALTFHFLSGLGAGANARLHWEREKARAESTLFQLADGTRMRVISYRPALIIPASDNANFGYKLAYLLLKPINFAVRSTEIGQAMLEVGSVNTKPPGGTILGNRKIVRLSNTYSHRQ